MGDMTPHERTAAALARSSDRVASLVREREDYRAVVEAVGPLVSALLVMDELSRQPEMDATTELLNVGGYRLHWAEPVARLVAALGRVGK